MGRKEKRLQTRWTQGYRKAVTLADEIEGEEVFVGDKVKGMLARAQLGRLFRGRVRRLEVRRLRCF